ncbi:hypothetical protein M2140_000397 [Clostridiales Family XIII bacterium PM5-7]
MDKTNIETTRRYLPLKGEPLEKEQYFHFYYSFIKDEQFDKISIHAKVLYCIMRDRVSLSVKNGDRYTDENGDVYIIYTIKEIMKSLKCGKTKAVDYSKELEACGLIKKRRSGGFNNTNLLYIMDYSNYQDILKIEQKTTQQAEFCEGSYDETLKVRNAKSEGSYDETLKVRNTKSEGSYDETLKVRNMTPIHTEYIHTKNNQIKSNQSMKQDVDNDTDNDFSVLFKEAIELDTIAGVREDLIENDIDRQKAKANSLFLTEMAESVINVVLDDRPFVKVSFKSLSKKEIKEKLLQVTANDFLEAEYRIKNVKTEIKNYGTYIITVLIQILETRTMNQVNIGKNIANTV